jgi:PIN domain nuclease of toxin-antitoxin system
VTLLDTHVLLHYANSGRKLGKRARTAIDDALRRDQLFISALSFWEIAMLAAKGRVKLDTTVAAFRSATLGQGIQELSVDGEIAIVAAELPTTHNDPADRIFVATAVVHGATLVTADSMLLDWPLRGYRTRDASV